jgi:hypothetical protein
VTSVLCLFGDLRRITLSSIAEPQEPIEGAAVDSAGREGAGEEGDGGCLEKVSTHPPTGVSLHSVPARQGKAELTDLVNFKTNFKPGY